VRSILTAQVAQVIPSTSKRTVSVSADLVLAEALAEDGVALLLNGVLDGGELNGAVIEGNIDRGVGDGHRYGFDTGHGTDCPFEAVLAVVAMHFGHL
jgi:hypothetical protein